MEWRKRAARLTGVKSERHNERKETDRWSALRDVWLLIRPGDLGHMKVSGHH